MDSLRDMIAERLGGKKPAPKPRLHMKIHKMDDGKFYIEHDYRGQEPTPERSEHAPAGIKELHDHIDKHFGEATPEIPEQV